MAPSVAGKSGMDEYTTVTTSAPRWYVTLPVDPALDGSKSVRNPATRPVYDRLKSQNVPDESCIMKQLHVHGCCWVTCNAPLGLTYMAYRSTPKNVNGNGNAIRWNGLSSAPDTIPSATRCVAGGGGDATLDENDTYVTP